MIPVASRVRAFRENVRSVCEFLGRNPDDVSILAATKYADADQIQQALDAGINFVGENRVQDAKRKFPLLRGSFSRHFIGHLQTNKVRQAVELFDCIESVDSVRLAEAIHYEARKQAKHMDVLIQINISGANSQFGLATKDAYDLAGQMKKFPMLKLRGFMTILPPDHANAESAAREMGEFFGRMRDKDSLIDVLSMGMSYDFKIALKFGSTELRIGSLFFGE